MQCSDCFTDYLVKCSEEINVFAQLAPLTSYFWVITDKFQRQYSGAFTTDKDGFWSIDTDDLPPGLLTQFSGSFTLQVQDETCKPIKFKVAQEYDCIRFDVRGGTREKNTLGCSFEATVAQTVVETYADITLSGQRRLIQVNADETNGGATSLYYWTGSELLFIVVQDVV